MQNNTRRVTRAQRDAIYSFVDGSEMGVMDAVKYARSLLGDNSISEDTRFLIKPEVM
jgi:hypothetical protein